MNMEIRMIRVHIHTYCKNTTREKGHTKHDNANYEFMLNDQ